jgi:hypothetical protein
MPVSTDIAVLEEKQPPKKITRRGLRKFQEEKYLENLPKLLEALYPAFIKGCKDGNPALVKMAGQVAGVLSKNDGPLLSLTLGMQQNNIVPESNSGPTSLEQLIRKLDSRERDAGSKTVIDIQRS